MSKTMKDILGQEMVAEGQFAPDFTLPTTQGHFTLSELQGKKAVLLYFMREFSCAICRQTTVQLGRLYHETFTTNEVEVVVIGGGSPAEAEKLAAIYKLPFAVAADPNREVYSRYGLDKAAGIIQRSGSILVDKAGRVRYVQRAILPTGSLSKSEVVEAVKAL
ncbi:MAG TPA: peroxiredoxin family protein [Chloroflexia bacterium]|nr:peroxiredoxin family protein [Chloroflexia bacterium]